MDINRVMNSKKEIKNIDVKIVEIEESKDKLRRRIFELEESIEELDKLRRVHENEKVAYNGILKYEVINQATREFEKFFEDYTSDIIPDEFPLLFLANLTNNVIYNDNGFTPEIYQEFFTEDVKLKDMSKEKYEALFLDIITGNMIFSNIYDKLKEVGAFENK